LRARHPPVCNQIQNFSLSPVSLPLPQSSPCSPCQPERPIPSPRWRHTFASASERY
jgi:hypothetical protein